MNRMWPMTDKWIQKTASCTAWPRFFCCTNRPRSEAFFKIRAFLCIHLVTRREGSSLYKMSNYRCESGEESLYITQRMNQQCTCGFPPWIQWEFYSQVKVMIGFLLWPLKIMSWFFRRELWKLTQIQQTPLTSSLWSGYDYEGRGKLWQCIKWYLRNGSYERQQWWRRFLKQVKKMAHSMAYKAY